MIADKKTIAICGDSFFSTDLNHPGASFGEYLCNKNNWNVVSLARPGVSNFAIGIQIDEAIKINSDFVVFGTTSVDRIELLTNDNISYNKLNGVSNIKHKRVPYDQTQNQTIITDVIANMLKYDIYKEKISKEKRQALKEYVTYCYDENIKRQYDSWLISDACRRLIASNIPFMLFCESTYNLWSDRPPKLEFLKDIEWIPKKYLVKSNEFLYRRDVPLGSSAQFHYCEKTGGKIWGDFIQSKYNEIIQD